MMEILSMVTDASLPALLKEDGIVLEALSSQSQVARRFAVMA